MHHYNRLLRKLLPKLGSKHLLPKFDFFNLGSKQYMCNVVAAGFMGERSNPVMFLRLLKSFFLQAVVVPSSISSSNGEPSCCNTGEPTHHGDLLTMVLPLLGEGRAMYHHQGEGGGVDERCAAPDRATSSSSFQSEWHALVVCQPLDRYACERRAKRRKVSFYKQYKVDS